MARVTVTCFALSLAGIAVTALGCGAPRGGTESSLSLFDRYDEARLEAPEGRFAAFAPDEERGLVATAEGARRAFTPPFPGRVSLDVTVPESGRLTFYPALVTRQEVRRALVDFVVRIDETTVFTETLGFEGANRWHERAVDLSAFSGRDVTLVLETRPFRGGADKLWADRVRTAWGEPLLSSGGASDPFDTVTVASGSIRELEAWLAAEAPSMRFDVAAVAGFAANLVLGGLLALGVRALYLRLGAGTGTGMGTGSGGAARSAFASAFPLFTLVTILVITVVEVSVALSLGLLGALSIVRFRTSIKTPEEIAYLLFCVGIGLTLGAGARGLAVLAVALIAAFEALRHRVGGAPGESAFVLTLSGEADAFFRDDSGPILERLPGLVSPVRFHRLDREGDRVALSTIVRLDAARSRELTRALAERFPGLDVACVDADAVG